MAKDENRSLWRPFINFPFFEEDFFNFESSQHSGLEVSEDDKNVFVEAHLPGLSPDDIEISFENLNSTLKSLNLSVFIGTFGQFFLGNSLFGYSPHKNNSNLLNEIP